MSEDETFGTRPLRLVDPRTMARIFEITDRLGISREAVLVPLAGEGEGRIRQFPNGVWEIVVPAWGPLEPFLARVEETLSSGGAA